MKTLLAAAGSLVLAALLLPALAQTPATTHNNPKPAAKPRQAQGTASSKMVGQKFIEKSKPDTRPINMPRRAVLKD
ncbi:hypothetical protein [Hymenobacter bucti]|uniref:Acid-shock protein n=1 Tax=Hymenobacter bucti TaxID=1844114 RepID=A0ABW4QUM5_9BACT